MDAAIALGLAAAGAAGAALPAARRRLMLSRAKHPSLAGHSRMARRLARLLPAYALRGEAFYASDGADASLTQRRREGLARLAADLRARSPGGIALTDEAREGLSDLRFTSRYRVPFQYTDELASVLPGSAFVTRTDGAWVTDVDGNRLLDVSGSYGVNLLGHESYKRCIARAQETAGELGTLLGSYHPCVLDNVRRLREISGLDEVSFHMSGTEAVMQAVRLARYHTGRSHLVRFCGAYHGWWDDVQPGPGTPVSPSHTYTLRDMDERTLRVLRTRRDIACVLVNPLQAMHPNRPAPGDSSLVDGSRQAGFDREAYARWLRSLRDVCTERGIVLIMDEVFLGFRLAPRGAQAYFDVQADLVTYGKTLGGGLPVGVLCGRADLMKRYREDRPADLCFARGTFNSHPLVMAAMNAWLQEWSSPSVQALYEGLDERWGERRRMLNTRLEEAGVPLRVTGLSTVWTVLYTQPSRYHWMFQFYLRDQGLSLSWVGSGRLIFSLDIDDTLFEAVCIRFVRAALRMRADGWWDGPARSTREIRGRVLREMLRRLFDRSPAVA